MNEQIVSVKNKITLNRYISFNNVRLEYQMIRKFFYKSRRQYKNILRCIFFLWKMNFEKQYLSKEQEQLNSKKYRRKINEYPIKTFLIVILLTSGFVCFLIILLTYPFLLEKLTSNTLDEPLQIQDKIILSNQENHSIHHIYIDIGCFNGETIEHFIHFTPNSRLYDIITFEPDPLNYQLCRQRLQDPKYRHLNITILQTVAWIKDEKISFRTERGRQSRINTHPTGMFNK